MFSSIREYLRHRKGIVNMVFVDTGNIIEIKNARDKNEFTSRGQSYIINQDLIEGDTLFYRTGYVEPIVIKENKNSFVLNTETTKFEAMYDSKVLKMLMYVQEKNMLLYIFIAAIASVAVGALNFYYLFKIIDFINQAQALAVDAGVVTI